MIVNYVMIALGILSAGMPEERHVLAYILEVSLKWAVEWSLVTNGFLQI